MFLNKPSSVWSSNVFQPIPSRRPTRIENEWAWWVKCLIHSAWDSMNLRRREYWNLKRQSLLRDEARSALTSTRTARQIWNVECINDIIIISHFIYQWRKRLFMKFLNSICIYKFAFQLNIFEFDSRRLCTSLTMFEFYYQKNITKKEKFCVVLFLHSWFFCFERKIVYLSIEMKDFAKDSNVSLKTFLHSRFFSFERKNRVFMN